jgi:glutamate-1-semialdehyde 2,1-aminomutase
MARSVDLFKRAQRVIPGGVNSPVRAFKSVGGTPVFMKSGSGPYVTSAEGKRYIDYCGSWGPLILGHARSEVAKAARVAIETGSTFGAATEREIELAEAIRSALPSMELVRLTSSGTEAVMSALRVARAFTKRELVIKFAGCYHGHADSLLVQAGSGATTLGVPDSAGVPAAWARSTISLPFNDLAAVKKALSTRKVAAIIVEPVVGNMGVVPPAKGFLEGLRALTKRHGTLLIFDEVITGFRLAYGGAQTLFKIKPDLTTLGKIIGGGLPLAAYGGRKEIMSLLAPLGPVYQAGTLSGNPAAVAAGLATLKLLRRERPYGRLDELAEYLCNGLADAARAPVALQRVGSMFTLFFGEGPVLDYRTALAADKARYGRFFHGMLERGVYFPPAQWEAAFVSFAHRKKELDATLLAASRALRSV